MLDVLLLAATLAHAQNATLWQPGATITDAASFQLTQTGLDALGDSLPLVFPNEIPLSNVSQNLGICTFGATNVWAGISVDDLRLIPQNGKLQLEADLQVMINNSLDPMVLSGCSSCNLYVEPFPVNVKMPVTLAVVDDPDLGHNVVDVTLGEISLDEGLTEDHIKSVSSGGFNFCAITLITQALSLSGISLIDFVYQIAEPILLLYIDTQKADIEASIEEQLQAAYYSDTVSFGGIDLALEIEPQSVILTPDGVDIRAQGHAASPQGACMVDRDTGGSLKTPSAVPPITENTGTTQFALLLSDDVANEALYAVWRSGLLCYDLANTDISLPFPLNTSLLGIIGGEGWQELFPESIPMDVVTSPDQVPVVDYQSNHDLTAVIQELGVDFYTEVDYRKTRALGVDLNVDAGVDLDFDGTTGQLDINVDLGNDAIEVIPSHNELVAGSGETIVANFGTILDVVIDQFLGGVLDNLSFMIPSFATEGGGNLGVSSLSTTVAGDDDDWLRAKAGVGIVQYDNTDAINSCGSSGGCSSAGGLMPGWALLVPFLARRRRVPKA